MKTQTFLLHLLAVTILVFFENCSKYESTSAPALTTNIVTKITGTTAESGGTITYDGGTAVNERGTCWSKNTNPTIADNKTNDGTGIGTFTSKLSGLSPNVTYYVRAFAINSTVIAYGNEISFKTQANADIPSIAICDQIWMANNLNIKEYRNGDTIPQVTDPIKWASLTTGAWCYYNNITTNGVIYGKLYNWYAVNDARGLAPEGWHIPTDAEWNGITTCLGGREVAGGKLKETGTTHWISPNTGANNEYGFTALPGGFRENDGNYNYLGKYGFWWTATEYNITLAEYRGIYYDLAGISKLWAAVNINSNKKYGFSIRCVKN